MFRLVGREIRKVAALSLLAIALPLADAAPSDAHRRHGRFRGPFHHGPFHHGGHGHGGHGRVFVTVGPTYYWGPAYAYWYYPPPPYYVYVPQPAVVQEPPVSAEATPAPSPQAYWYYCPSARAYYPTVPTCPETWVKVPPRPK